MRDEDKTRQQLLDELAELRGPLKQAHDELERRVEQRTAELTRANEELAIFRKFAEASGQGFSMADLDGHITYLNPAMCRLLGEDRPEEVIGKHLSIHFSEPSNRRGKEEIEPALSQKGYWEGELPMLSRHGTSVPTWHNTFMIRDENGTPLRIAVVITDISERKKAEEALRQTQATLDAFFGASTAILNIVDDEFRYLKTDSLTPTYFGLDSQSIVGKSVKDLSPHWFEQYGPMVRRVVETGEPVHNVEISSPVPSRPGEMVYWRASYFPVALPGGKRGNGVVGVEITDMRRAEEALRQNEEKYRGLVEACPDAVVMSDLDGKVLFASRQTWRLLGLSDADELIGHSVFDFVIASDRGRLAANMTQLIEGGVRRDTEYTVLRKDGVTVPTETSSAVIRDAEGRPKAVMAVIRDIARRKETEAALRESEERLRTICDSALDAVVMVDSGGKAVYWNPAAERMFGYSRDEMMGREVHAVLPPDRYRESVRQGFSHFAATGAGEAVGKTLELTAARKDGSEFPIEMSVSAFRIHDRWCAAAIVRDVTERKRAREALEREQRTLKHLLQSSDHERQLIAYDIHDGLAQQLAGAIMQFQVYEHLKSSQPDEAHRAYDGGVTLLRQSHFEARRLISGVRPPILDESGVVTAIAHLVHEQQAQGGPQIEFHSKVKFDRLAPVLENVIYRIVQEGLANACRHSKTQMVRIVLMQRRATIGIEIRDWGIGFDPKSVPDNRFGLAGIRERARLLGGKCRIQSKAGEGTAIIAQLPLAEQR